MLKFRRRTVITGSHYLSVLDDNSTDAATQASGALAYYLGYLHKIIVPVRSVIVKNRQIVATGYNGTPSKLEHCSVTGCLREQLKVPSGQMHELCRGIHAEQNAVVQAAYHGVSVNGGTLYLLISRVLSVLKY